MFIHYLVGFFMSMVPMIELKGSILYMIGMTLETVGKATYFYSFLVGYLGSSLLAPLLLLLFIPIIEWMKTTKLLRGIAEWLESHFRKKSEKLEKQADEKGERKAADGDEEKRRKKVEFAKYFGLFVFTAIPLPLTGVWTASVVAAILKLDYKKSLLFIVLGNLIAAIAITVLGGVLGIAFFGGK